MRIDAKVDSNQPEIVRQLRGIPGVKVVSTAALGKGFGDIVVGYRRVNYLIEIKNGDFPPSKRKLTDAEKKFHAQWTGQIDIAKNFEECLEIIGISTEGSPF